MAGSDRSRKYQSKILESSHRFVAHRAYILNGELDKNTVWYILLLSALDSAASKRLAHPTTLSEVTPDYAKRRRMIGILHGRGISVHYAHGILTRGDQTA